MDFLELKPDQQLLYIQALREKRKSLQFKTRKQRPIKLPTHPFKTEQHKMVWLSLPSHLRNKFI
jgi:hypothetical protein